MYCTARPAFSMKKTWIPAYDVRLKDTVRYYSRGRPRRLVSRTEDGDGQRKPRGDRQRWLLLLAGHSETQRAALPSNL